MRLAMFLTISIALSGCVNVNSLVPEERQSVGHNYFLIDTKFRLFCRSDSKNCKDMTKIVSARAQLQPIETAYGKAVTGPNYPISLSRMIMQPEDGHYNAKPIGDDGRFFSIPVTPRTQLVWDTLSSIEEELYPPGN